MKKRMATVLLVLALALGLCAGAVAAPAWSVAEGAVSVGGLEGGQYAFVAGYDDAGRFLGAKVLSADGDAQPIPGAAEVKLFWTDGQYAPLAEAVSLPSAYQTVRKVDGQVVLCYEGPGGVTVTTPVTEKITGSVASWNTQGTLRISGQPYPATELTVEGCDYAVSHESFQRWDIQPGVYLGDTLDFYLDPWGNICWIDLVAEYVYPVETRLLLSVGVTGTSDGGTAVQAELMQPSGAVFTTEVTILDGQSITDPNAAVEALSAHAPGGFYACQWQRGSGFAMTATENTPGSGWGATITVPPDTVTAPAADFTGGAVNCLANEQTIFVVSRGLPGEEKITRCVGYGELPAVTVLQGTVVTAEGDDAAPVARFVYLRTLDVEPPPPVELPKGCFFIVDNRMSIDPELYEEDVYQVHIIGADSMRTDMRVSGGLGLGISYDSMEVGRFADNYYVGKFCAITGMDQGDVVTGLKPMEAAEVLTLENGVIETAAGSWNYDTTTRCVYANLGWKDMDGDGVRGDGDQITLTGSSFFDPDNSFIGLDNVSPDPASGAIFRSIKAAVIAPEGSNVADYVYLIRELW